MDAKDILNIIAEGLEVDAATLKPDAKIADIREWNSIAWLTIMSLLDERCNIQVTAKEVSGEQTVQGFIDYIQTKAK
jgi:acyl carrier protein